MMAMKVIMTTKLSKIFGSNQYSELSVACHRFDTWLRYCTSNDSQ